MKRAFALVLLGCTIAVPAGAVENAAKSLTYARWVDIGPGRSLTRLAPAELAELRRCANWTMYFLPADGGVEQVFVAGMTIGTRFPKMLVSHLEGETIFMLSRDDGGRASDTLHLSKDGNVLTQMSPPFRPHTYLRCVEQAQKK
jgi:hypothetical protein